MSINHWLILSYNVLVTWWRITGHASTFFYWTFSNVWLIIDKKLIKLILKILQQQCQKVRKSDEIKLWNCRSCLSGGCSIFYFLSYQILVGSPIVQMYCLALWSCRLSPASLSVCWSSFISIIKQMALFLSTIEYTLVWAWVSMILAYVLRG